MKTAMAQFKVLTLTKLYQLFSKQLISPSSLYVHYFQVVNRLLQNFFFFCKIGVMDYNIFLINILNFHLMQKKIFKLHNCLMNVWLEFCFAMMFTRLAKKPISFRLKLLFYIIFHYVVYFTTTLYKSYCKCILLFLCLWLEKLLITKLLI